MLAKAKHQAKIHAAKVDEAQYRNRSLANPQPGMGRSRAFMIDAKAPASIIDEAFYVAAAKLT